MNQELKNKFNDIIQELNSVDLDKLETHQKNIEDMLSKTRTAIDILRSTNPNVLVATSVQSNNCKPSEWFELDRKNKPEPIVPPKLKKDLLGICENAKTHMLSCLLLGLGNGYWIKHLSAFEQIHTVDFYQDFPEELKKSWQPKFLNHLIHSMLDKSYEYTNLDMIPNNEIGYIYSWDFLPYFTIPQLEKLFKQMNDKLIKGGKGLIHFANADNNNDLDLIKKGYYNYNDQKTITKLIFDYTNFDIEQIHTDTPNCSYIQFKKPGDIDWKKQEWWRYNLITKRDPEVNILPPND
jgi:hypothetical protein|tara:strand:- start:108 stop:989 length:882 start_codon:yes stop_codon:yes gene_type:complete